MIWETLSASYKSRDWGFFCFPDFSFGARAAHFCGQQAGESFGHENHQLQADGSSW
jgi:hypothetical protein